MTVQVRFYTDPACPWSWGAEPALRRLMWEFEGELEFVWVMGGLAREYRPENYLAAVEHFLDATAASGMPSDPRLWTQNPIGSTYPACKAVKAAVQQGWEAGYRYLRRLREGLMFERRKLDHADALTAVAGEAGLDRDRFDTDLDSQATADAFEADLEEVRHPPEEAREDGGVFRSNKGHERISFPAALFIGEDASRHGVWEEARSAKEMHDAALVAGAKQVNEGGLDPPEVISRFGPCATPELEVFANQPPSALEAQLWALARDSKLKPVRALSGMLWETP